MTHHEFVIGQPDLEFIASQKGWKGVLKLGCAICNINLCQYAINIGKINDDDVAQIGAKYDFEELLSLSEYKYSIYWRIHYNKNDFCRLFHTIDTPDFWIEATGEKQEYMFQLEREWRRKSFSFNWILKKGAFKGNERICHLMREWGATDFNRMLFKGAKGGHQHICLLALEWGGIGLMDMFLGGKKGGHEHICQLAKELGLIIDIGRWENISLVAQFPYK